MSTNDPLHRFGSRAQDYAAARPDYAPGMVAAILDTLGLPTSCRVVDLGCGTGISTRAFLRHGLDVTGIEPNAAMLDQARALLSDWPRCALREGRAESSGLTAACADLIVAAQAFHWFDVPAVRAEALRIGRQPVAAALIWNDRDTEVDAFSRGYEQLVREFGDGYDEIQRRHNQSSRADAFFGHTQWQTLTLRHTDALSPERLLQRITSASYMPQPGHPHYPRMHEAALALHAQHQVDGLVTMAFSTRILCGRLAPAPVPPDATRAHP